MSHVYRRINTVPPCRTSAVRMAANYLRHSSPQDPFKPWGRECLLRCSDPEHLDGFMFDVSLESRKRISYLNVLDRIVARASVQLESRMFQVEHTRGDLVIFG